MTDGYYSDTYTAISGLITYTFKNADTLAFAGEGNVAVTRVATFVTPPNAEQRPDLQPDVLAHAGPWTISPYLQYRTSPNISGSRGCSLRFSATPGAARS